MRLLFLTTTVMFAFAANSVLNRMALTDSGTGPAAFAVIRLASGAVFLIVLAQLRSSVPWRGNGRLWGAATLALYVLGFSFAYVTLDAGVGALILFGGVQITMFAGALMGREKLPVWRWLGALVAFAGLLVLLWPGADVELDGRGVFLMALASIGWGIYSLLGRGAVNPLGKTAVNFALALPVGVLIFGLAPDEVSTKGAILAVISGAVTSGAGYALWYSILPALGASVAAVAQLTVPIIAVGGGFIVLGEPVTLRFAASAILVMAGVLISLRR